MQNDVICLQGFCLVAKKVNRQPFGSFVCPKAAKQDFFSFLTSSCSERHSRTIKDLSSKQALCEPKLTLSVHIPSHREANTELGATQDIFQLFCLDRKL